MLYKGYTTVKPLNVQQGHTRVDPACETESEAEPRVLCLCSRAETEACLLLKGAYDGLPPRLLPPLCSRLRSVSALCSTLRAETEREAEQRQHEGTRRKEAELSRDTERGRPTPYLRGAAPAAWHVSRETCTAHITRLRTARDVRLSACQHVSIRIRTPVHVSKRCHHKSPGSKVSAHITRLRTASAVRLSACQHVSMASCQRWDTHTRSCQQGGACVTTHHQAPDRVRLSAGEQGGQQGTRTPVDGRGWDTHTRSRQQGNIHTRSWAHVTRLRIVSTVRLSAYQHA